MDDILRGMGLLCIIMVTLHAAKKIMAHLEAVRASKGSENYEDNAVYKAACVFAAGGSEEELKHMLADSYQFDSTKAEQILLLSNSGRVDRDHAYAIFIKAVNDVLGEEVYRLTQS
ncbi:hypothetical protein [Gorillibacterium sp. CAU 1737]|uniref:hypothetical protein n=1 Tax=Gorillibacterium sp. CAU 1737 TaxID=3140362 RepID=UPI003260090A